MKVPFRLWTSELVWRRYENGATQLILADERDGQFIVEASVRPKPGQMYPGYNILVHDELVPEPGRVLLGVGLGFEGIREALLEAGVVHPVPMAIILNPSCGLPAFLHRLTNAALVDSDPEYGRLFEPRRPFRETPALYGR